MFLLEKKDMQDNSTLQENQIKINTSLGIKNPPHHSGKRRTVTGITFYAAERVCYGRGGSVWKLGGEGDALLDAQNHVLAARESCNQNLGESHV